ncbi:hypothetical protein HYT26_02545 [Candidatus Pacearchaeota archaeon]|nr:hypothetical protein [Candidatus Pacearchaeota archaeon]
MKTSKIIIWGIAIIVVILLIFASLGFRITKSGGIGGSSAADNYASLPEKCRPPSGQDIASWKEHLGHHAETQDCLNYFN